MRYWRNASGRWNEKGPVTLNMIVEFLETFGYDVINKPVINKFVNGLALTRLGNESHIPSSSNSGILLVDDLRNGGGRLDLLDEASSYLLVADEASWLELDGNRRILNNSIVVRCGEGHCSAANVEVDVLNYMMSVEKFASALSSVAVPYGGYQGLMDIAEEFFGCFISLVDANNKLIARTRHIEPQDPVNMSLVQHGFHLRDILNDKARAGHASGEESSQNGVRTYSDDERFPYSLVTSPIVVYGHMVAYLVMCCDGDEVTAGTEDAFSILVRRCEWMAIALYHETAKLDPGRPSFLLDLISESYPNHLYVHQRASKLGYPLNGWFIVAKIVWGEKDLSRVTMFTDELNRANQNPSCPAAVATRVDDCAILLVAEESRMHAIKRMRALLDGFPANRATAVYISDPFAHLVDTHLAYQEIQEIAPYDTQMGNIAETLGVSISHIRHFRDVFCLYWNDPFRNAAIQGFAVENMLIAEIMRNDRAKGADDLDFLMCHLACDRKASETAKLRHLSRNGVLYRIRRITEHYDIDLENYIVRQYLQASYMIIRAFGENGLG